MSVETLTVNGTDLATLVYIDASPKLFTAPARRGDNLVIPGRHGALRLPRKLFDTGEIVLSMRVLGHDPDQPFPTGSGPQQEFHDLVDQVVRLFTAEQVVLDHGRPDGSIRRAVGEVTDLVDFTRSGNSESAGQVSVAIELTDPFWSDLAAVTAGPNVFSTGGTHALTGFAGATAPMDELVVTFGPGANPELTQPSSGYLLAYDGVIAAGQQLQVDSGTWSVGSGSGSAWTPDVTKVRFGPESRFFSLQPEAGGVAPTVRLTHTGGGQVSVTIVGKRRFLTG